MFILLCVLLHQVNKEIVSGLKYVHLTYRKGIRGKSMNMDSCNNKILVGAKMSLY